MSRAYLFLIIQVTKKGLSDILIQKVRNKVLILNNKKIFTLIFSGFVLTVCSIAYAVEQEIKYMPPIVKFVLDGQLPSGPFLEQDGLIVVEMESLDAPQGWAIKNDDSNSIGRYIEWTSADTLGTPGNALISAKVVINNPGTYRFIWRSSIREGNNTTEANDSFLKILANNFYGFRTSNQSIVCPRGQESSNRCDGSAPNGASNNGWFKVYRSGGTPPNDWVWRSFTSDNDAHSIFADFDQAGEYEVQISARSQHHAIDRFVLFRSLNNDNNVNQSFATDSARPESVRAP